MKSPTADVPAIVRPGEALLADVRVTTALTPPPGVQQSRALREWSARLIAHRPEATEPTPYEYRLAVSNVRPISGASLDYRVRVLLPAWLAPGLYDLAITGPGGESNQTAAVRVMRDGVLGGANETASTIVLARGEALSGAGQGVQWFPASSVGLPTQAPRVVGFIPAGVARPEPKVSATPIGATVVVEPAARAGFGATLHAQGVPSGGVVAWSLSDGTTAFGPTRLQHVFEASGPFDGDLIAIAPDGRMAQVHFRVEVEPGVRFGCQSVAAASGRSGVAVNIPLILALALLKRRPRTRAGISSPP